MAFEVSVGKMDEITSVKGIAGREAEQWRQMAPVCVGEDALPGRVQ